MANNKVVRSAVWYTASNILVKGIGFITVPIFTRLLTQAEYGVYSNYLAALQVMTIVVTLSLESTIINAKKDFSEDLDGYVFSMMVLSCLSAAVWLLVVNIFPTLFEDLMSLNIRYINAALVYLVFFPVVTLYQTWERFTYRYKTTVLISLLLSIGVAAVSVALAVVLPNKLDGAIAGRALPAIAVGAFLLALFIRRGARVSVSYWRYSLPIALPYIPHLLSMALLGALNKLFITQSLGAEANALYSLAYSCGQVISIFVTSLNTAFSPWLGDSLAAGRYADIRMIATPYVALFAVMAIAASMVAPETLLVLGGEGYLGAQAAIPPVAIGCILQFAYCLYVNVEQYEKKTSWMALASASAVGVNALLDVVLVPRFGYISAAWASAAAYAWLMAAHMLIVGRTGMLKVYDNASIVCVTLTASLLVAISQALYSSPAVRLISVCILAVAFFGLLRKIRATGVLK